MAVSLRNHPIISGKNAQKFLERETQNKEILQKKVAEKLAKIKTNEH